MHCDRVYSTLKRFGLDAGEAEDVVPDVFLRAWRSLPDFKGRAKLSTWLYRIAFNEAQRRMKSRDPALASSDLTDGGSPIAIPERQQLGPEAQSLDREFEALVRRALDKLPIDWRAAVVLRDIDGLTTEEAAEVCGLSQAAFKSRLHRTRMHLRTLLAPYLEFDASDVRQ
jgi:RNA polymerase sigma-70 factor, ECF subfamily